MNRDQALAQIAEDVTALISTVRTSADHTIGPGTGADGIRRPRPENHTYRATHLGLLFQLIQALPPGAAGPSERHSQPGSRPPSAADPAAALEAIAFGWYVKDDYHPGIRELRAYLRRAAGRTARLDKRYPLVPALLEIRAAAHTLSEEHATYAAHAVRAYVHRARSALAYDARVTTLKDVACRICGGALKVRKDASSDVWCATPGCVDEGGQPTRWPRDTWYLLLAEEGAA